LLLPGDQYRITLRQDIINQTQAAGDGGKLPEKHSKNIRSENHEQRTKKQQGRKKETSHDREGKEGCQEIQEGVQGSFCR